MESINQKILGLSAQAHSNLLHHIMDTLPIKYIIMSRTINFFIGGLKHDSKVISDFFKNTLLSSSSFMLTNINTIINKYNINYQDLFSINKAKVKEIIKVYNNEHDWRSNIVKELLSIREGQKFSILDPTEIKNRLHYITTLR